MFFHTVKAFLIKIQKFLVKYHELLSINDKGKFMKNLKAIFLIIFIPLFVAKPVFAETFQDFKYTIIEKSNLASIKSSIDIRLFGEKVTKDFLHKLALKLRDAETRKYDRLFITYYLPGMTPVAGAWATTHFDPNLEVKILGTMIEEEKVLLSESKNSSGKIIGEWLDESPYVGAKYKIVKQNGKIIMMRKFKDGRGLENEIIQKTQSGNSGLRKKEEMILGNISL